MAHLVEDDVGSRSTIVDVAEDVQLVYGKPLYHVSDGDDKVIGTACGYDGVDDDVDISCLVMVFCMFVQEFLYDVREVAWQRLSHLRAGVFARHITAYCHQLVQCDVVPVVDV